MVAYERYGYDMAPVRSNVLATRSGQPPVPATHFLEMAGLARSDSDRLSPLQLLLKAISIE
jgi:hypothetical protein